MLALFGIALSLLVLYACTTEETPVAGAPDSGVAGSPASDPLTGTWSGDWGPMDSRRNPVTAELKWDGANLSGTVNPGLDAVPITKASFVPDTGMVMMEASAPRRGGDTVHFVIEGKLANGAMTGTWEHDDKKGDFKIAKS